MRARQWALFAAAAIVAAVCVRLGVWQLSRLEQRRAYNAAVLSGMALPLVPLESLRADGVTSRYRRVSLSGRYDHANELVLANRHRRGSPGVHVLTPLLRAGSDTAVLVVRGWVYAPDASRAELGRWREDNAEGETGYVQTYESPDPDRPAALQQRILRRLTHESASAAVPYPLAPYYVVLTDTSRAADDTPPRLGEPVLGEGSHLSYAFQWFAFAAIALAGTVVYLRRTDRTHAAHDEPPEQP